MTIIEEIEKIVGKERLIEDEAALATYSGSDAVSSAKRPICAAKTKSMEEVQKIVKLANEKNIALVPCSSDKPHKKGGTTPKVDKAVVLDLSGMDKIIRIDERSKTAMVEPGVTYGDLQAIASPKGLRVVMPFMPKKTKSIVGSLLEREPTTIPKYHWDIQDPLSCVEVIFGTGDMFRTGSAAGPGSIEEQWAAGQAQKSPMGPAQTDWAKIIQGSQGTMGVVTWASLKLELLPKLEKAFFVGAETLSSLIDYTYAIIGPRLVDMCLIINRENLSAIYGEENTKFLPPWLLFYSISGYEHFPEERVGYIEKDIADIANNQGINPVQNLNDISAGKFLKIAGSPSEEPYWKSKPKGGYQDLFFLSTLDRAPEFVSAFQDEVANHDIHSDNIGIYIQPIQQGRNCHIEFTAMHDPSNKDETIKTGELISSAAKRLIQMGGFFSRPYDPWTELAYSKCPDTVSALFKVKGILDPNGVMNPGKLCFQ